MGLRDKLRDVVGLEAMLDNYVGRARDNVRPARDHHAAGRCSSIGDYDVTNVDILVRRRRRRR